MQSILSSNKLNDSDRSRLNFALAKANEDLGDIESLFKFLNEGNNIRKKQLDFSFDNEKKYNDITKEIFKSFINEHQKNKTSNYKHIFIVGMPRSGTTLVEHIISSKNSVIAGGELRALSDIIPPIFQKELIDNKSDLSFEIINSIKNQYIKKLKNLNISEGIVTDKWPLNFKYIGFILLAFPEVKIVHLKRSSMAICWSIYRHYFSDHANGWAYSMKDIANFYKLYEDLMDYWRMIFPDQIYDIDYENLTINQEIETRKLIDYCDLEWNKNCLEFYSNPRPVDTASVYQVRKKMYKGSSEVWKKYENFLQPLKQNLLSDNL